MKDSQTFSIVTPSYNQAEFLPATIESVLAQAGDFSIDYIIVDGGSTDGSVEIVRRYEGLLQRGEWPLSCAGVSLRWLSEKDNGQADAVNKGFRLARGEFLGWLNSDDTYLPAALATAQAHLNGAPETVMVYGNAWYTDREGSITGSYGSEPFSLERLAERSIICQPAVFLRREALAEVGLLDESLHTCLDFDLWIRLGKRFGGRISFVPDYLATSRMYPDNKTVSLRDRVYRETFLVAKRHFGYVPGVWVVHNVLEVLQSPGMSFLEKIGKLARDRSFFFRYLLEWKTLLAAAGYLFSRGAKSGGRGAGSRP